MAAGGDAVLADFRRDVPKPRAPGRRQAATQARRSRPARAAQTLSRQDWVLAARSSFIKGGIHTVKVDHLARRLGVTRGSFYFHFRGRADLLDALFQLWRAQNAEPFEEVARDPCIKGWDRIQRVVDLWLEETRFSPAFDTAMRDWARSARRVADAVRAADRSRIALLDTAYREMGFADNEASIRARVTYSQQVGYYALAIHETKAERRRLLPLYDKVLALRGAETAAPAEDGDSC